MNESINTPAESIDARRERVLTLFEKMRAMTHDEIVEFWHKLMAEEAELIHELRQENQVLSSILSGSGLQLATDNVVAADDDLDEDKE